MSPELERQLAVEAKKRQRLNNTNREFFPYSEKGKASEKAVEMRGINPHYVADAKQIEQGHAE